MCRTRRPAGYGSGGLLDFLAARTVPNVSAPPVVRHTPATMFHVEGVFITRS
jgi:hypothetical protein